MNRADLEAGALRGLTMQQFADERDISVATVVRAARRLGFAWPHRSRAPATQWVWDAGSWVPLSRAAARHGLNKRLVQNRWAQGVRGPALLRKPSSNRGRTPSHWDLGYSLSFWQQIRADVLVSSVAEVTRMTGLPRGAVGAAARGEWERLG